VRVEELSPFPAQRIMEELTKYAAESKEGIASVVWVQEEPANAGAWSYIRPKLNALVAESKVPLDHAAYVGRPAIAAPAVGNMDEHNKESEQIIKDFLAS